MLIPISEEVMDCMGLKPACTAAMPATMLKGIIPGISGVEVRKSRQKTGGTSRGYRERSVIPSGRPNAVAARTFDG